MSRRCWSPRGVCAAFAVLTLASCGGADVGPTKASTDSGEASPSGTPWVALDAPRLLRRASLDLRGVLPSVDELDAIEADPTLFPTMVDAYLEDPRFEERYVALIAEQWRTTVDIYLAFSWEFGLDFEDDYAFLRSVGEEPARLVARVVAEDRPYTEIVTADWTMANEMSLRNFPLDGEAGEGWRPAVYTDARPAAGVLSTNGLWWRYVSPIFNYNRRRTAAVLDLLVCEDILSRPVEFPAADAEALADSQTAILEDPTCRTCHATIEPIAATLFGFLPADTHSSAELSRYHPEREPSGPTTLGVSPAWYGQPVSGLAELGRAIAADGRFVDCAVRTAAEALLRRPVQSGDAALLRDARDAFVEDDLRLKSALRNIVAHPVYQAGAVTDDAAAALVTGSTTRRILIASHLRSVMRDLVGFQWIRQGADELDSDVTGFRSMAGGLDGDEVTDPLAIPGLTWTALTRRLGQAAARSTVDHDFADASPYLLTEVSLSDRPGDPAFDAQLDALVWRLHAVRADATEHTAWADLWTAAYGESGDASEAWAVVLGAMFRDPAFLTY